MKKLLTLLMLLCMVCTGAWAQLPFTFTSWTHEGWTTMGTKGTNVTSEIKDVIYKVYENKTLSGNLRVTIKYQQGNRRRYINGVELLQNNQVVYSKYERKHDNADATGAVYEIANVEEGNYTIRIWSSRNTDNEWADNKTRVNITAGETAIVTNDDVLVGDWLTGDNSVLTDGLKAVCTSVGLGLKDGKLKYQEEVVTFTTAGKGTVSYNYTGASGSGNERLDILGFEVLNQEGTQVVSSDAHYGYTGTEHSNREYTYNIPAAGTYKVRTWVDGVRELKSQGTVTYTFSASTAYSVESNLKVGGVTYTSESAVGSNSNVTNGNSVYTSANSIETSELTPISVQGYVPAVNIDETNKKIMVTYTLKEGLYNLRTAFSDNSKYGVVSDGTTLKLKTADAAPDAFNIVPSEKTNATVNQPTYYIKTTDGTKYWTDGGTLGNQTEVLILDKNATGVTWENATTPTDGFFAIVPIGSQGRALGGKPNTNLGYASRDLPKVYYGQNATSTHSYSWVIEEVSNDPITSLDQLRNYRAYTITSYARGQWTAVEGKDYIYQTKGTDGSSWGNASDGYTPIDSNNSSANQQWAILKSENNNYYLYNVGLQKFFIDANNYGTRYAISTLGEKPNNSTFNLVDKATQVNGSAFYTADSNIRWAVSMNNQFFGITNWTAYKWRVFQNTQDVTGSNKSGANSDQGMYFKIVPVEGLFDFSEAMEKIRKFEFQPITYTFSADGKPNCVHISVNGGEEIDGTWLDGIPVVVADHELSNSEITITTDDGYVVGYNVDNTHHQVNFTFTQLFVPIENDGNLETAKKYVIKNADNYYLKYDNGSIPGTLTRSEADKFVFVKHATNKGHYYIYSVGAQKYLTYTTTGNGSAQTTQTNSKVQLVEKASAKCWVFDAAGHITPEDGGDAGLNFMGGANLGKVLNLYLNSDRNSVWQIIDSEKGSLACAVTMFSLPGAEYMHKLIPETNEVTVTDLELLDGLTGLELKTDRQDTGNRYAYVHGFAPTEEGVYHYNVCLSDGTKASVKLTVSNFLQAPTPGMVWVSWNWFKNTINSENLYQTAQGLKSKGLFDAGYNTIVIDDAWGTGTLISSGHFNNSTLAVNTQKFSDMPGFVKSVNDLGIHVGIYSDASDHTCGTYQPGSLGVEQDHINMFNNWGIDFLKYDYCGGSNHVKSYTDMGNAIANVNATRKEQGKSPFVFNACEWGKNRPWEWGAEAGTSMWRATSDAREDWLGDHDFPGVLAGSDEVREVWMYAGVNRFNDLDMMCIGLHGKGSPSNHTTGHRSDGGQIAGLTTEQARSQMSIWSMFASPLSISCDVRETPDNPCNQSAGVDPLVDPDLAILKNADIIRVSQDPLGQQAEYMASLGTANTKYQATGVDVYVKDMVGGQKALAIVNRDANGTAESKTINFNNIYLDPAKEYTVKDVWANETFTVTDGQITTGELAASQTKVYIISEIVQAKVTKPESERTGGLNGKFVGTFSSSYNVELPEGYKAYTAVVDGTNVTFNQLGEEGNRLVPANTGVLLYAEKGVDAQNATPVRSADVEVGENAFRPTTGGEIPVGSYILANQPDYNGVCFYVINPAARTVVKGKAYLVLPELPASVQAFSFGFDFEQEATTGINSLESIGVKGASYDLQGRRVSAKAKGVTIVNGAKVIR